MIFFFLLLFQWEAQARIIFESGGSSFGNGGHSVQCWLQEKNTWSSPQSLDLYEGQKLSGYTYPVLRSTEEAQEYALSLARKVDVAVGVSDFVGRRYSKNSTLTGKLRLILERAVFVNAPLKTTDDAKFRELESNCKLQQTINFGSQILFHKPLWDQHSYTDQSALLLHEAIYWYLRSQGKETDSRRVRRIVAHLIQGGNLLPVVEEQLEKSSATFLCKSKVVDPFRHSEIYVFVNQERKLEIRFRRMGNYRMLSQTVGIGPEVRTELALDREPLEFSASLESISDRNSLMAFQWNPEEQTLSVKGRLEGDLPIADELSCAQLQP